MQRIKPLESLRGLLALWVVVGHTIKHTGYAPASLGPFRLLAMPELAVDVFIMLSGFVIFLLLDHQRSTYLQFIHKRWFRIAPLFLAELAVSALTLDWQMDVIRSSPFPAHAIANDLQIHQDAASHLFGNIVMHALMLHGALPAGLLPNSSFAIIGQGWSISVEWQFYLLAPLLFLLVSRGRWLLLGAAVAAAFALRLANYGDGGFAFGQMAYFMIGIASYYGWKHSDRLRAAPEALDVGAACVAVLLMMTTTRTPSLLIWTAVMYVVVAQRQPRLSRAQAWLAALLESRALLALGTISYSLYLVHMLVLYAAQDWLDDLLAGATHPAWTAAMLLAVVSGSVLVAALTYRFIELPGIAAGRRLQGWLRGAAPARCAPGEAG